MKNFLKKYFGYFGLVIYAVLSVILRIPVFAVLVLILALMLLIWNPLTDKDNCPTWVSHLYDWYCGK